MLPCPWSERKDDDSRDGGSGEAGPSSGGVAGLTGKYVRRVAGQDETSECATNGKADATHDLVDAHRARCLRLRGSGKDDGGHGGKECADTKPQDAHCNDRFCEVVAGKREEQKRDEHSADADGEQRSSAEPYA